jgi:LacI family transcriptional regulator
VLDGVIVSGVNHQNLLDALSETGLPFTVLGDTVQGPWLPEKYDVVHIDDTEGAYQTTRYLRSLGHTKIVYIANTRLVWFARRYQGYARAMVEDNLEPIAMSIDSDDEHEVGFLGTKALLTRRSEDFHAVFTGSDATAFGAYAALREAKIRVPEDLSICGFNDTPDASLVYPPLTSVCVFPDLIGRSLAELLLRRIAQPSLPAQDHLLHTKLIKRCVFRSM